MTSQGQPDLLSTFIPADVNELDNGSPQQMPNSPLQSPSTANVASPEISTSSPDPTKSIVTESSSSNPSTHFGSTQLGELGEQASSPGLEIPTIVITPPDCDLDGNLIVFKCFGKLPIEIRHMVWNEAVDRTPRIFEIDIKKSFLNSNSLPDSQSTKAFTLTKKSCPIRIPFPQVNKESRKELSRKFHRVEFWSSVTVFMNLELDTIFLSGRDIKLGPYDSEEEFAIVIGGITHHLTAENALWNQVRNLAVTQELFSLIKWLAESPSYQHSWPQCTKDGFKTFSICYGDPQGAAEAPAGLLELHSFGPTMPPSLAYFLDNNLTAGSYEMIDGYPAPPSAQTDLSESSLEKQRRAAPEYYIPPVEFKFVTRDGCFVSNESVGGASDDSGDEDDSSDDDDDNDEDSPSGDEHHGNDDDSSDGSNSDEDTSPDQLIG